MTPVSCKLGTPDMGPKKIESELDNDLFRHRLDNLIDMRHELVRLSELIDWPVFESQWGALFEDKRGAPALPTRLIAGLQYLKHTYKLSDEDVVRRWVENPYFQYFCGETYFQHRAPIHPTSLTRWRKRIGEEGCEWLLTETIEAAKRSGALTQTSIKRVNVDTTVQEKAVTFPTDSKLLDTIRRRLIKLCQSHGIGLRQNYNRVAKHLLRKISGYAHAKQYKRMRAALKKLSIRVGRVVRDIERQLVDQNESIKAAFVESLSTAKRLLKQKRTDKNKLYSIHAPETECISKGKAHKRYEFGVKASFATTNDTGYVVGARSYPGNPYDGHTLEDQLQQVETLTGQKPTHCYVDRGYRGHGIKDIDVKISGQRRLSKRQKKALRRRSAIEPEIGHMKTDGLLGRCFLKGVEGDAMNVVLAGCGLNLRKILRYLRDHPFLRCFLFTTRLLISVISQVKANRLQIKTLPQCSVA